MRAQLIFNKKEVYPDGSLTKIRIWQVNKSKAFPAGIKYSFYFIGPPPIRTIIRGYDNHHGKGHHQHFLGIETAVNASSVSALLQQFHQQVEKELQDQGVILKGSE